MLDLPWTRTHEPGKELYRAQAAKCQFPDSLVILLFRKRLPRCTEHPSALNETLLTETIADSWNALICMHILVVVTLVHEAKGSHSHRFGYQRACGCSSSRR